MSSQRRLEIPESRDPDVLLDTFVEWSTSTGISLYPHQEEAIIDIASGANTIVATPTGSGKSLIAIAAHYFSWAKGERSYYTAPIKALVSEKFFSLVATFGAAQVGMVTGDASVNADAPIICCTPEILANLALREGTEAQVGQVVSDEFHFIADPDRGWAWQVPLSELPQAQFVLMSATLGDTTGLRKQLTERTGRDTTLVAGGERPVPLVYSWSNDFIHETLEELAATHQTPVYVVHPSQAAATERAQSLLSAKLISTERRREIVAALGGFSFSKGFGQTLSKLIRSGIGVHHAGMLPRYRRLVETLAQQGLLSVICGTDTLGVGINVPIRTVVFSQLSKFDGRRQRVLTSREFHQIAGRAGRAGFDTTGYVIAQAPEYHVENERALAKAGDDPKKRRKVVRKKPPEGTVNYTEATFTRLIESTPETLHARMRITPSLLLNISERDSDTADAVIHVIDAATSSAKERRRLRRRAASIGRSLLHAGVIQRTERSDGAVLYQLDEQLQDDFALNQPLSAFAMAAFELLDEESPTYALDAVSIVESTLSNPMPILLSQQFQARGEAVAELKADGYDYEERMEILEEVTWPQPLAELLDTAFAIWQPRHPWIAVDGLQPKSVVREMFELAMTFGEYVAYHKIQRSEGLLLRYISEAYRAMRQTIPERFQTESLTDIIEWLGEIVRHTDSSLLDEWEELTDPEHYATGEAPTPPQRLLTSNQRAFTVLVRNAMFRLVQLVADDNLDGLVDFTTKSMGENSGQRPSMDRAAWDDALDDYYNEHETVGLDAEARSPRRFVIDDLGSTWRVTQIIADPEHNDDWHIGAVVDLDQSNEAGELVLNVTGMTRVD